MKWIKTFEEVNLKLKGGTQHMGMSPDTYRRAAGYLSNWNKSNRADKLSDWADEKQYGIYNMTVGRIREQNIANDAKFTMPILIGVYYGYESGGERPKNLLDSSNDVVENMANKMVDDWVNGDVNTLSIMFEFGLKPTKEAQRKSPSLLTKLKWNGSDRYCGSLFPTFRINLILTDETYGKEDYYEEYDRRDIEEPDTYQFYEDAKYEYVTISRPFVDETFALFSDRKSAIKFKNLFSSMIDGEFELNYKLKENDIKSYIVEVLRLLGGQSSDIERIMDKLKSIRIHGLYDDEKTNVYGTNLSRRWYNETNLKPLVVPYGRKIN